MNLLLALALAIPALSATPPGFDAAKWKTLVEKVSFVGTQMEVGDYTFRTFSNVNPKDTAQPRQADYFSAVGVMDTNHRFSAFAVSAVSEGWSRDDKGNWVIDQWIWDLTLDGDLRGVNHNVLVESSTGTVLSDEAQPNEGPASPAELNRWSAKLASWLDFRPSGLR